MNMHKSLWRQGVVVCLVLIGSAIGAPAGADQGHAHASEHGPRHGALITLTPGELHAELVITPASATAQVFIYGATPGQDRAVDARVISLVQTEGAPLQIALRPQPQPGDPEGRAACFGGSHAQLADVVQWHGKLIARIDGVGFSRMVQWPPEACTEHAHDDHSGADGHASEHATHQH